MPHKPVAAANANRAASTPAPAPNPRTLRALHASILARLATACDHAAARLQAAAADQSVFANDADLKTALALLKFLPHLLPLIAPPPPRPTPPPLDTRTHLEKFGYPPGFRGIPLIPKCEHCGAGPGAHWTEDCPNNPNRPPRRSTLDD
jgi:hypothetical protein